MIMAINIKDLSLRADLILSVTNAKRFNRWRYNYFKKGKRKKNFIKFNRRVKNQINKPYFRKLIFKL